MFDDRLKEKFPLPHTIEDVEITHGDVAAMFGVSENTVTDWRKNHGLPVKQEGGNGKAYGYQASDVWAWQKNREVERANEDAARRNALAEMRLQLFPDGELSDEVAEMSPAERIKNYEAEQAFYKTERFRLAYCPRENVRDLVEELLTVVKDGISSYANTLENEAALTPKQVAVVVSHSDRLLATLKKTIEENDVLISSMDASSPPISTELPLQ